MADNRYEVKIEDIFEGPMDLLVYLIKKNEVDIYDIPIALITAQYLGYLEWMKAMNINVAADFLLMAATLAQIKSRMLLPRSGPEEDEDEDPRMEIARPLAEYLQIKEAAADLSERELLGEDTFLRSPPRDELRVDQEERTIQVSLFELIDAFQRILENMDAEHRIGLSHERFSIKDRISRIVDILEERGSATLHELLGDPRDKEDLIVSFLAILEMAKHGLIRIAQQVQSGIIRIFYE